MGVPHGLLCHFLAVRVIRQRPITAEINSILALIISSQANLLMHVVCVRAVSVNLLQLFMCKYTQPHSFQCDSPVIIIGTHT